MPVYIDLSGTLTADNYTPNVNSNVLFTTTIVNSGANATENATGLIHKFKLPDSYIYVSDDSADTSTLYDSSTGLWTIGDLPRWNSISLLVSGTVRPSGYGLYTVSGETFSVNELDFDSSPQTGNADDYSVISSIVPIPTVDLLISESVSNLTPNVNSNVSFTTVIQNASGFSNATNLVVFTPIPSGYTYVSDTIANTSGTYSSTSGYWDIGTLAGGASLSLSTTATVKASGDYVKQGEVVSVTETDFDSSPADQAGDDYDTVTPVPIQTVDLSLTLVSDTARPKVGDTVVFTATLSNEPLYSTAEDIEVTLTTPSGYLYVSHTASSGIYSNNTGLWQISGLPSGVDITLDITANAVSHNRFPWIAEVTSMANVDVDSTPDDATGDDYATATYVVYPNYATTLFDAQPFRNRFRLVLESGLKPEGFVYDVNRMPDRSVDLGTAVIAGSVWDGDNRTTQSHFHITEISGSLDSISGTLELSDYKSHFTKGLPLFQAGMGDNADCQFSGIKTVNANTWHPVIQPGIFYDPENELYLHSSGSIELIISGTTDLRTVLATEPLAPHPITMSTYYVDKWGGAHVYERFNHKVRFTSWSGLDTLEMVPNSSPPLYRPSYSGIRWYNVDTTKYEFMVDRTIPEVIRSRNITSGVHTILRKVPYSYNQYQLPLVPVEAISGTPTINVFSERVAFNANGLATPAISGLGTISGVIVTSGGYVRLSGNLEASGSFIQTESSVTGWPPTGTLIIDDMIDQRFEQLNYQSVGTSGFLTTATRVSGSAHREQSQIRLVLHTSGFQVSGILASGFVISGTTYTGDHFINYDVTMTSSPLYDKYTGLMTVSGVQNTPRADLNLTYYRGISLCYEPSGLKEYNARPALNVNPLIQGNANGMLWFSTYPSKANTISVIASKQKDSDNIIGPVFAGNDFLTLTAQVKDYYGAPVSNELVSVSLDNSQNIGKIDGIDPLTQAITKTTNSNGEAAFTYTPPQTIHGLGYFTQFSNIVDTSGLEFAQTFELKEILTSGIWNTLTFAVWQNDEYDAWSETSGQFNYTADGRFEIISVITAGSLGTYATFAPIKPIAALNAAGQPLGTSGLVKTLVYNPNELPTTETGIGAFFVSAEKQINLGIVAPNSKATSKTMRVKLGIPAFMQGELTFGPLKEVATASLDSLAYLTINPYTMGFIDEHRFDPRQLGNVFRIQGTKNDEYIRNKFYILPDWLGLAAEDNNDEVTKFFTFRNRVIVEI